MLLDGHVRLEILREVRTEAECQILSFGCRVISRFLDLIGRQKAGEVVS